MGNETPAAHPGAARPGINLQGHTVMVVEDELLVAMLIEETLLDEGCLVVGPFNTVATALAAARDGEMQIAVLDVNLQGERVYPVAEALEARGIPFLLLSGYGADAIPAGHPGWVACAKPFMPDDLLRALSSRLVEAGRAC
jgi:DNA-binding NtrC family response regulator